MLNERDPAPTPPEEAPFTSTSKVLLVIGPESSGTRVLTSVLAQHPGIHGPSDALAHADPLDDVWYFVQTKQYEKAAHAFPANTGKVILTRRSLPHGLQAGGVALFGDFADIEHFYQILRANNQRLELLITVRDPIANLASWTKSRASPSGDMNKALEQYHAAYLHLFSFIARHDLPYLFVSLESLMLGNTELVQSLFQIIGLQRIDKLTFEPDLAVNAKHYASFQNSHFSLEFPLSRNWQAAYQAAAQIVDEPGALIVEFAGYPHSIIEHLHQARKLRSVESYAPNTYRKRIERIAANKHIAYEHQPFKTQKKAKAPRGDPSFRLVAMDLGIPIACDSQQQIRLALDRLASLVQRADRAVLSLRPARRVARLVYSFLIAALRPKKIDELPLRSQEPPPGTTSKTARADQRSLYMFNKMDRLRGKKYDRLLRLRAGHLYLVSDKPGKYTPLTYRLGEKILFGREGLAELYQRGTWTSPLERFTPLHEGENMLKMPLVRDDQEWRGGLKLHLKLHAATMADDSLGPDFELRMNGTVLQKIKYRSNGVKYLRLEVTEDVWKQTTPLELCLCLDVNEKSSSSSALTVEWLSLTKCAP